MAARERAQGRPSLRRAPSRRSPAMLRGAVLPGGPMNRKTCLALVVCGVGALSCGPGLEEPSTLPELSEPVRIETRAATFVVRESMAADFGQLLAGEPTLHVYFA